MTFTAWENLPMEKVRAAIDVQRKICKAVLEAEGKYTKYDTDQISKVYLYLYTISDNVGEHLQIIIKSFCWY